MSPNTFKPLWYIKLFLYNIQQTRYLKEAEEHNEWIKKQVSRQDNKKLRIIKTIRDIENANHSIDSNYKPLMKKIIPSDKLKVPYTATLDPETKQFRYAQSIDDGWCDEPNTLINPYELEAPYATYLVPIDIQVGERVILNNLIEDHVGRYVNGIPSRLKQCEAIWNGKDFDVDYDHALIDIDYVFY